MISGPSLYRLVGTFIVKRSAVGLLEERLSNWPLLLCLVHRRLGLQYLNFEEKSWGFLKEFQAASPNPMLLFIGPEEGSLEKFSSSAILKGTLLRFPPHCENVFVLGKNILCRDFTIKLA